MKTPKEILWDQKVRFGNLTLGQVIKQKEWSLLISLYVFTMSFICYEYGLIGLSNLSVHSRYVGAL